MEFELIAKTFVGLENILAEELRALGASDVRPGRRVVYFKGDKELMYRANFFLRTAIRILKPIRSFTATSAEDVYKKVSDVQWEDYISQGKTFAVDSVAYSDEFANSHFVAYKVKDAVVDYFRNKTGTRPNISVANPDIRLHIHISDTDATLSLDSSGDSLHRRGYRQESVEAPLNEVLAAGIILQTGWKGETDFIDPMCGSGTFLIEAALIARNMAPGLFRKSYAFEKWNDFDKELFQQIYNDDSGERGFEHHIYGYDIDAKAVNISTANVKAAGLAKDITIAQQDFKDFAQPAEKAIIVTNPPYGERMTTPNLLATYKMIGERLKHAFNGNEAWILSYKDECFRQIGLKPSVKIPLYNGSLPCELHQYQMFDGKFKEFRQDGGTIKREKEREDAKTKAKQKNVTKFQRRREEQANNEEGDIRSFTFHSLEREKEYHFKPERKERRDDKRRDKKDTKRGNHKADSRKPGSNDRKTNFNKRKKIFGNEG